MVGYRYHLAHLTFILALVLLGCETLPPQPDKTAVYHTANETLTEANTELNDFFDKMIIDESVKSGEYHMNNKTIQWQNS